MKRGLVENTFFNIRKIMRKSHYLQMKSYKCAGDLRLLRMISYHYADGATPSQLAQHMDVTLPTMSQKLTILENLGFIERINSTFDRRKTFVHITYEGKKIADESYQSFVDKISRASEKIGEEKIRQLNELLEELLENLEEEIQKEEGDEN